MSIAGNRAGGPPDAAPSMGTPISADDLARIDAGRFVRLRLAGRFVAGDGGAATSAFVGRVDGRLVAYANLCRHRPVPLDLGSEAPLSPDGAHLTCGAHRATYRLRDGLCVEGPCAGQALHRLAVEEPLLARAGEPAGVPIGPAPPSAPRVLARAEDFHGSPRHD